MEQKKIEFNTNDKAIVAALKLNAEGLTLAELSEATGIKLVPGNITSAKNKHLINVIGTRKVMRDGTRSVFTYSFVTADPLNNAEGKPNNYTDGEKRILAATAGKNDFTLDDLAVMLNVDKVAPGSISGLVKKGNIAKSDEKIAKPCKVSGTVNVYALADNLPAEFTE